MDVVSSSVCHEEILFFLEPAKVNFRSLLFRIQGVMRKYRMLASIGAA